ncbi:MAG: hypothetical protein N2110_08935 [Flavobacteriales bacterium]|nr:hypothetical protein [Flavobacteriales bacterium]
MAREVPIVFDPLPADDPRQRRPDISLARQLLGWEPQVSRREGLRRTLDYYLKQYSCKKEDHV